MMPGMTFTIEPMITEGSEDWVMWDDGWTVATHDYGRAAQFEHCILITDNGCEILTV
jgi:methionyl aminopeptidase